MSFRVKPLPSESRRQPPAFPWAGRLRGITLVLLLKVVALTALWRALFHSSSHERPLQFHLGHALLERQPVSPVSSA